MERKRKERKVDKNEEKGKREKVRERWIKEGREKYG